MFVEGAGFEPAVFKGTLAITIHIIKHRACIRPLGQPSNSLILDFFLWLKTSEPHGWLVVIRNPIFISNKNFSVCVGRCQT